MWFIRVEAFDFAGDFFDGGEHLVGEVGIVGGVIFFVHFLDFLLGFDPFRGEFSIFADIFVGEPDAMEEGVGVERAEWCVAFIVVVAVFGFHVYILGV